MTTLSDCQTEGDMLSGAADHEELREIQDAEKLTEVLSFIPRS